MYIYGRGLLPPLLVREGRGGIVFIAIFTKIYTTSHSLCEEGGNPVVSHSFQEGEKPKLTQFNALWMSYLKQYLGNTSISPYFNSSIIIHYLF